MDDDQYDIEETKLRMENILKAALSGPPTPLPTSQFGGPAPETSLVFHNLPLPITEYELSGLE
jgi:hypothetical protein